MFNGEVFKELLNDKRVLEEINRHLWIESQKAGYSIGRERATDEWLQLYAEGWMRYNLPERYAHLVNKQKKIGKNNHKKEISEKRRTSIK